MVRLDTSGVSLANAMLPRRRLPNKEQLFVSGKESSSGADGNK